jgi:dynein heavy chain
MLLVGLGGSGKMALCKLAGAMMDIEEHTIEAKKNFSLDDWKDELKKILKRVGVIAEAGVFILEDINIHDETYFEDINSLLKCGEIPMLFSVEEEA